MPLPRTRFRGVPARHTVPAKTASPFVFLSMIDELRAMRTKFDTGFQLIERALITFEGVKKGDRGIPGQAGTNGRDGKNVTAQDLETAVQKYLRQPSNGKDGMAPSSEEVAQAVLASKQFLRIVKKGIKSGKDGESPAVDSIVGLVLEEIGKKKLSIAHIEGLDARIAEIRHAAAMGSTQQKKGGGGDTVAAGSNITLSHDRDGNVVINATGGGSSAWSTPPENPNGVITVFTVGGSAPTDVVADGIAFYPNAGYTYAAGQITFVNPPTQYVRYR